MRASNRVLSAFNKFKEECKVVTLQSAQTNTKINVIKYRNKIYQTGNMREAFSMARNASDLIIPDNF